ncbi:MAG: hypothetical protein ACKPKO_40775, partial [Candidatus Fonsibacter sp.]
IICNNFEPTTVNTDMIIKADTVLFGDTLTHTSLSGSSSNFYSEAHFYQYLRAKNGIESGYDNEVGLFISTFTMSKTRNGYISGNFNCGGLLTAPNIYNRIQVDNLVSGKQNTITSSTDLTINKLTFNNFEPTTVNTDMVINANRV